MTKKSYAAWRRYRRSVTEIQAIIDAAKRPWWMRLLDALTRRK